jgi:rare lipoprotein A
MTRRTLTRHGAWLVVLLLAGCATAPEDHAGLGNGSELTQHFSLGLANSIDSTTPDVGDVYSGRGETRGALAGPALPPAEAWTPPPPDISGFHQVGEASWYGKKFAGRRTASGERYDMLALTAAHRTLPLASFVRVTNPANGKSVVVRINDRGPFRGRRIIDLSLAAATALDLQDSGTGRVELQGLSSADAQAQAEAQAQAAQAQAVPARQVRRQSARALARNGRDADGDMPSPAQPTVVSAADDTMVASGR